MRPLPALSALTMPLAMSLGLLRPEIAAGVEMLNL